LQLVHSIALLLFDSAFPLHSGTGDAKSKQLEVSSRKDNLRRGYGGFSESEGVFTISIGKAGIFIGQCNVAKDKLITFYIFLLTPSRQLPNQKLLE